MRLLMLPSVTSPAPTLSMSSLVLVSHGPWLPSTGKLRAWLSKCPLAAWDSPSPSSVLKLCSPLPSWCSEEVQWLVENLVDPSSSRPSQHPYLSSSGASMLLSPLWKLMMSSNQDSKKILELARKKVNLGCQTLCCDSKRFKNTKKIPTPSMRRLKNLLLQSEPPQHGTLDLQLSPSSL